MQTELADLERQKAVQGALEKDFRARENFRERISFAAEIYKLQQDQLRLEVEAEFVRKKIRRLQLGYAEDAVHVGCESGTFAL
ncbi:MAG: hypothetical protein V3573_00180 [Desulfovibrionaceae bacterium]